MNNLIYIAILLVVIWVIARVVGFVAGALLHLLWVIAIILVVIWLVRRIL
jgi:hypothetical protein